MTHNEFVEFIKAELDRIEKLVEGKDADYAGRDATSAFSNFHEAAEDLEIPVEKVWWTWVFKHWSAVRTYARSGGVSSEPIDGRLDDVIGYCLLLKGIIAEKKRKVNIEMMSAPGMFDPGVRQAPRAPDDPGPPPQHDTDLEAARRAIDKYGAPPPGEGTHPLQRHRDSMG